MLLRERGDYFFGDGGPDGFVFTFGLRAASSTIFFDNRDGMLILLAYRHGLRVSELVALRWDQVA